MAQKEFKVYKNGIGEFYIKSVKQISARHILCEIQTESELMLNDILWADSDMHKNDISTMLVVDDMKDGNFVLKRADQDYIINLREIDPNELFKLISTFREVKTENESNKNSN